MEAPESEEQETKLAREVADSHTVFRRGDNIVGLVSQNPDNPKVLSPGAWSATIHTADEGLWAFGPFQTREQANEAVIEGLGRNLTFEQWVAKAKSKSG
jgi:hypothetical protein